MRKALLRSVFLVALATGLTFFSSNLLAVEDLNQEFVEDFFQTDPMDGGASLTIKSSRPPVIKQSQDSKTNQEQEADNEADPSWISRFLQVLIILLLGLVIYLMSRRSRKRGRY